MNLIRKIAVYSGVAGVVVIWTFVITAMQKADLGLIDVRPISFLGIFPPTSKIFSSGLLISSTFFIIFAFWVAKTYSVKNKFLAFFLLGQIGQVLVAILPYGMESNYKIAHTVAAFALAFSLPFLIFQFYRSQIGKPHYAQYRALFYFELITFLVGMGIFTLTEGIAPLGEALPAIGFHIWIIIVTKNSLRTRPKPLVSR